MPEDTSLWTSARKFYTCRGDVFDNDHRASKTHPPGSTVIGCSRDLETFCSQLWESIDTKSNELGTFSIPKSGSRSTTIQTSWRAQGEALPQMFAPTSAIENTFSSSLTIRRKLSMLVSCKFSSREIFIFQSRHFTPCTRSWRSGTKFLVSCHSAVSPRASALAVWSFRCRNESLCECATSLRFSVHFQSRILRFCKFATSLR